MKYQMKRETLEKAILIREDILQIERMSSIIASGKKAYFVFQEGYNSNVTDKQTYFSERMTAKMVSLLQEYKMELEKEIEQL